MFTQILDPMGNLFVTWLVALIPVVGPAGPACGVPHLRLALGLIGSVVTVLLALWVWKMPAADGTLAYVYGSADRHLERRLDHVLGRDAVQHAGDRPAPSTNSAAG